LSTTTEHLDASITMVNGALAIAFTNSPVSQGKVSSPALMQALTRAVSSSYALGDVAKP